MTAWYESGLRQCVSCLPSRVLCQIKKNIKLPLFVFLAKFSGMSLFELLYMKYES